jgi:hypothetical protein
MAKASEHEADAPRQQDYRRGYRDGVAVMISAFADKLSYTEKEKLDDWFIKVLSRWSQASGKSLPPDPPRL